MFDKRLGRQTHFSNKPPPPGGDVNKCRNDGVSPIFMATVQGHADCLNILLAAGADPRSSWKGTSALDKARQKNHSECVRVLEAALA